MTTDIENIAVPLPIVTDRLILRNVAPADSAAIYAAKTESFDILKRWMPWAKELGTMEDQDKVIAETHEKFKKREDLMIVGFLKAADGSEGDLAICTGLHRMNWDLRIFEIGFWVPRSQHRKGIASESTNALTRYAFHALNASKVSICHASGNEASRGVIEKLGFEKEGVFKRDARLPDGSVTDHHWYARFDDKGLPALTMTW